MGHEVLPFAFPRKKSRGYARNRSKPRAVVLKCGMSEPPFDVETALSPGSRSAEAQPRRFRVEVVKGVDAGSSVLVEAAHPGRVLIGQGPTCDLVLTDPLASRRHVAISSRGGALLLTDLESTNGTLVNGVDVSEVYIRGGERIVIGETTLVARDDAFPASALSNAMRFGRVVGASTAMRALYPLCERVARSAIPVLIEGETGTGKEMLAESLHEASGRAAGPFIVFDCTVVASNLVESALFGHERGAFTGAVNARRGVFEQAHGGTLFIDEVGDLDLALQPKLLRAIERAEVQRVGAERWTKVDVRVVSATRRNLDREVQEGRFRDDLFFRLAVARIELPPLRHRDGDVDLLARHLWRRLGGLGDLPPEVLPRLRGHTFPGNIRELQNMVSRRLALGELDESMTLSNVGMSAPSSASDLPGASAINDAIAEASIAQGPSGDFMAAVLAEDLPLVPSRQRVAREFERRYVERLLLRHGGDSALAAASSGIARRYFQLLRARQR